jgi:REP element-mobilizing transposase RayT
MALAVPKEARKEMGFSPCHGETRQKRIIGEYSQPSSDFFYDHEDEHGSLHDFVIMPDHLHLILTVDDGMTVEKAMQLVKGRFSYRMGKELGFNSLW